MYSIRYDNLSRLPFGATQNRMLKLRCPLLTQHQSLGPRLSWRPVVTTAIPADSM